MKVASCSVKEVKQLIESVGNKIGSVHFVKRSDGSLRKMCYRLHVQNPKYAPSPTRKSYEDRDRKKMIDDYNYQITVFDVNKVVGKDECGNVKRGGWRTVALENVKRICVNGMTYEVTNNVYV